MSRSLMHEIRMELSTLENKVRALSNDAEENTSNLDPAFAIQSMGENSTFIKFLIEAQAQIGNARRNLAFAQSMMAPNE